MRLKGRFQNITMISVYAPTEDSEENEKDKFYDDLIEVCGRVSRYDIILILSDYNAKIGKESFIGGVVGKHSLHESTSGNGMRVCDFAACLDCGSAAFHFNIRISINKLGRFQEKEELSK